MKSIVKWAGGKSRLLPELLKNVPKSIDTYVEPFAGGAALFFELARRTRDKDGAGQFRHARLADRNAELVTCYRAVRDSVEDVVEALQPYRYDRGALLRDARPRPQGDERRRPGGAALVPQPDLLTGSGASTRRGSSTCPLVATRTPPSWMRSTCVRRRSFSRASRFSCGFPRRRPA
ncbi:MAG: DNA adenine methylase [Myxococcales bacterium]|nr:DNA adenine methylase [Myxococcales bacterium]